MEQLTKWIDHLARRCYPVRMIRDVALVFMDRRISRSGAELAYYALMSSFPLMILLIGILGVLPIGPEKVLQVLSSVLPEQVLPMVQDYVAYVLVNLGPALLWTGLISTIMAASAAFRGLLAISAEIFGRRVFDTVKFWLFSFLFSLLLLVFLYLSMVVVLTGTWFLRLVNHTFQISLQASIWHALRTGVLFAAALFFLMLTYRFISPHGIGWKERPGVFLGALCASAAITAFSALFSMVITISNRYSMIYGSFASVIILMVWMYTCSTLLVLGIVVNYVRWQHRKGQDVTLLLQIVL